MCLCVLLQEINLKEILFSMSNIIGDCLHLWSKSSTASTNEDQQMNKTSIIIEHLINMGRIVMAISFICCFYFLMVCVFTHQQGAEQYSAPESIQSIRALKLKDELLSTDSLDINVNQDNLASSEEKLGNIRQPKSIKLSKLMSNYRNNKIVFENELNKQRPAKPQRYSVTDHTDKTMKKDEAYSDCGYHLAFTLIERDNNEHLYATKLMNKFSNTLTSILVNINSTNLDPGSFCIHLITDDIIRPHLRKTIANIHEELAKITSIRLGNMPNLRNYQMTIDIERHRPLTRYFFIDSTIIEKRLDYILPTLRTYFTHTINSYYSNALFFYSLVLHQVIPSSIAGRLILLDVDVQLDGNILLLYEEFGRFKPDEMIGIAYEQQPVYR